MAAISELKVSATDREVAQDVSKLSLLLEQADAQGVERPLAFVGIFDNHASKRYRWSGLDKRLADLAHDASVRILKLPDPPRSPSVE